MSKVDDIKSRLSVVSLWERLYPGTAPKTCRNMVYHSPFRADKNASFSVFGGGQRFKDHATGEGGDVISFAALAFNCTCAEAIRRLAEDFGSLPEQKRQAQPAARKQIDRRKYEMLKKQCLDGFKLASGSCIHSFLAAKRISRDVAAALNREGTLGCYCGCPAYIYPDGIKVRRSAESSRSTRWLIGSDGGLPWRFDRLAMKTHAAIITEGESDAMLAMSAMAATGAGMRVLAAPSASWNPSGETLEKITRNRLVILAFDNDEAGEGLRDRIVEAARGGSIRLFPWEQAPGANDLCEIGLPRLGQMLREVIET